MSFRFTVVLSVLFLTLAGCASKPQLQVDLAPSKIANAEVRVGVVMTPLPAVDTNFPGASCLLCLAAASIANSSMTTHTQKLPSSDLANINTEIVALLKKKGANVKLITDNLKVSDLPNFKSEGVNVARKDFTSLKAKFDVDKLVVIDIGAIGIWRYYNTYFPTDKPRATILGLGLMVNLADNTYDWFMPLNIFRGAEGEWDEPPSFPGLTNAYYQALEAAKDTLKMPFKP